MSYLVFDIETVPDKTLWTPEPPKPRSRKKTDEFPPLYAHRPIAIGFMVLADDTYEILHFGVVGTTTYGDDEAALIAAWSGWVQQLTPTLVSFNGRAFDIAVLQLRSIKHGVSLGWHNKDYRNRYGEQHIDLFEQVTSFGMVGRSGFSLSNMSALIGLPPKGENDGSKVAGLFAEGKAAEIEAYCGQDVVRSAFLFLRYQLMRGRLSIDAYRGVATSLIELCTARGMHGVLFGADMNRLLLQADAPVALAQEA